MKLVPLSETPQQASWFLLPCQGASKTISSISQEASVPWAPGLLWGNQPPKLVPVGAQSVVLCCSSLSRWRLLEVVPKAQHCPHPRAKSDLRGRQWTSFPFPLSSLSNFWTSLTNGVNTIRILGHPSSCTLNKQGRSLLHYEILKKGWVTACIHLSYFGHCKSVSQTILVVAVKIDMCKSQTPNVNRSDRSVTLIAF